MIRHVTREQLIAFVEGDADLVQTLIEHGVLHAEREGFAPRDVERALVCRTLLRELDVNLEGVEIIVHLRERLLAAHLQVRDLLEQLRQRQP
jgi:hypothetical protein